MDDFNKIKKVESITSAGINYLSVNNKIEYISFEECNKNWIEHVLNSGEFDNVDQSKLKHSKCVGIRNSIGSTPYIEFFSKPRMRFEFKKLLFFKDNLKKYYLFVENLHSCGWSTYDYS